MKSYYLSILQKCNVFFKQYVSTFSLKSGGSAVDLFAAALLVTGGGNSYSDGRVRLARHFCLHSNELF